MVTRTPIPSPTQIRPFEPTDCGCGGSLAEVSRSSGSVDALICNWKVPGEVVRGTQDYGRFSPALYAFASNQNPAQMYALDHKSVLATEPSRQTIHEDAGSRLTITIRTGNTSNDYYGLRLVQTTDKRYQFRADTSLGIHKAAEPVLKALDAIEACAVQAITRRDSR